MKKRFLAGLLTLAMLMTLAPVAFAAETSETLQSKIDAIQTTGEIVLDRDYTATSGYTADIPEGKNITIDLNGHKIENTAPSAQQTSPIINHCTLTIKDSAQSGEIVSHHYAGIFVGNNSNTTIEYAKVESVEGAVLTGTSTGATITINDGVFSASDNFVVAGNGTKRNGNPNVININGGTFTGNIQSSGYIACGIYAPWKDIITINDGDFIVNNGIGIVARAGQVIVNGGTFTCNGSAKGKVGDKNFDMDAAQAVYFDASDPAYPAYNSETDYIKLQGGKFSSDVSAYVAEGYIQNKNGTVEPLGENNAVAKIGDTYYKTLADAIAKSENNDTIKMVNDTTITAVNGIIFSGKSITLDLNGKVISATLKKIDSVIEATGDGARITVEDTSTSGQGKIVANHYGLTGSDGGTITVNSGTIETGDGAALSGNNTTGNMNFIVNGGTLTAKKGPAIYQPGQCELTITGGTLNGGISLRMGQVNISGGTINAATSNIDSPNEYYNYSGNAWLPDALYVFGGTYSDGDEAHGNSLNLNITGGTFNCSNGQGSAIAIYDLGKVTQTKNITISGSAKLGTNASSRTAYQVLSLSDIGVTSPDAGYGNHSGNVSSSITGGYFTTDPTDYLETGYVAVTSDKSGYNYMVAQKTDTGNIEVKPDVEDPVVDASAIPKDKQSEVTNAVKNIEAPTLGAAATAQAQQINAEAASALIAKATDVDTTTTQAKLYVQTALSVVPTAYNDADGAKTLTVNITPQYRIVASTAPTADEIVLDKTGKNAQVVQNYQPMTLSAATEISMQLPTGFANDGDKLSVKHTKDNGTVEYYTGTVSASSSVKTLTFTTNGFSPFTISAAAAFIGETAYPTLQEAVDNVKDGETIKLAQNVSVDTTVTVAKSITFKVDTAKDASSNYTFDAKKNIVAGSNTTVTVSDSNPYTYNFTYSRPSSGSGSTSTTYAVNVNAATNGTVAADKKTASKGTTVTVTATPSTGYVVDSVKVVDKDGKDVAVTVKNGKYVFTMPASAVTVTATFKTETPAPSGLPFTDVKSGDWFYDAVKYAYENGLMNGTSETIFAPNGTMNRAMIVTVLYRLEKSPAVTAAAKFTDVPAGQWYSDAVAWAAANNIVNGYDETTFGPLNAVTREQMAAILYRYEQYKGLENVTLEENLNRFPDKDKISAYAVPALQWAVGQKIINGNADGTLDPTGTATRAQVAQIFMNLLNK